MAHSRKKSTVEAVVLRSFDVGEADRFCILFTKERGRMPVRARGVRKPGSRLGSILLPLQHVSLDIEEHSAGTMALAGSLLTESPARSIRCLTVCSEAAEMVLRLTEDLQESDELFEHCRSFFAASPAEDALLPFTARLLSLLGVLPLSDDDLRYAALGHDEQAVLHACVRGQVRAAQTKDTLGRFVSLILQEHLRAPMVTPGVRMQLA